MECRGERNTSCWRAHRLVRGRGVCNAVVLVAGDLRGCRRLHGCGTLFAPDGRDGGVRVLERDRRPVRNLAGTPYRRVGGVHAHRRLRGRVGNVGMDGDRGHVEHADPDQSDTGRGSVDLGRRLPERNKVHRRRDDGDLHV